MGRFINPFTDIGFKRIFGQEFSKPLLLDFLNSLLKGERVITDLTFLDKEQPGEYRDDRSLIYDIYCRTDTGERIIVEMQNKEQPNFADRCLYYYSQAVSRQGERGSEWDYRIDAVYMIAFVNFHMEGLGEAFRTDVALCDVRTGRRFTDKERFVFLQLPCFRKEAGECEDDFERWIYVLKNMDVLERMPWVAKDSVFHRLAEIGEVSNLSKEERVRYDSALRHFRDTLNVMRGAEEKGMREGKQEGMREGMQKGKQEGRLEERLENARKMKALGLPTETIEKITGLGEAEIERL